MGLKFFCNEIFIICRKKMEAILLFKPLLLHCQVLWQFIISSVLVTSGTSSVLVTAWNL